MRTRRHAENQARSIGLILALLLLKIHCMKICISKEVSTLGLTKDVSKDTEIIVKVTIFDLFF